jgi:type IV pilus assembly protein PilM
MVIEGQLLGLDVGQSHLTAVRLVERENDEGEPLLEAVTVGEVGLPRGTLDAGGHLKNSELLTEAVRSLRKHYKVKGQTVMAVSGAALSIQPVQRPGSLSPEQLESGIRLEIEAGLPYRGAAHISYEVLRKSEDADGMTDLLAVAVHRAVPIALARAVNAGGLRVVDILPEPLVLPRALNLSSTATEILLTVGLLSSSVIVVRNGRVSYAQSMPIGADHFTQALAVDGMPLHEAERWKREHSLVAPREGLDPFERERARLRATADRFVESLYQLIAYATSEAGAGGINRLLLCGGGSQLSGLLAHLNMSLGVPVELAEPSPQLLVSDPEQFPRQALAYALAMVPADEVGS